MYNHMARTLLGKNVARTLYKMAVDSRESCTTHPMDLQSLEDGII